MCGVKSSTDILGPNDDSEVISDPYFLGLKVRTNWTAKEEQRKFTLVLGCMKNGGDES